jgi:cation diffusion facilitator CzcD-associated flavoprotein CzcO
MSEGPKDSQVDVVVVGAGFAGLYALHRFRNELGLSVRVFEAGGDVGGTWYWNRYPGARCDIESYSYSFSFDEELQQEWEWSERFAAQPEILRYLNHVADRFDLRRDIEFETRVTSVTWDEESSQWEVTTDTGERVSAPFFVSGVGNLSVAKDLEYEGLDRFGGQVYSTGKWPHEGVDFTGLRVGLVGTGASGIQAIPEIAKEAGHLTVFQRTPGYATPIGNGPMDPEFSDYIKANYKDLRKRARDNFLGVPYDKVQPSALAVDPEERRRVYEERWKQGGFRLFFDSYADLLFTKEANDTAADFIREQIRRRVDDPKVAEMLSPKDYAYATKRPPLETGYYEAFNRDNVTLVDLRETPIEEITENGIRTAEGEHEFDVIVLATGFDAMTGPLLKMNITGRDGLTLNEAWADGPHTYLGLTVKGFPNLFAITGPQSPSVLYNMPLAIEDHADWIGDAITHMRENGIREMEPTAEAQEAWGAQVAAIASQTLMPTTNSWYMGANVPGKPRVFMVYLGGAPTYRKICDDVAANGYEGFALDGSAQPVPEAVAG